MEIYKLKMGAESDQCAETGLIIHNKAFGFNAGAILFEDFSLSASYYAGKYDAVELNLSMAEASAFYTDILLTYSPKVSLNLPLKS